MASRPNSVERLVAIYRSMVRIRAFETTAWAAHKAGEIPGVLHVSLGQEAIAACVCAYLTRADRLTSTHRGHGHTLAKGADPARMMAELYGRVDGFCRGKGGSMHIADFSVGMLGANGVVGGGIPIAVGAAQGLGILGETALVACFFGDGAVNRGPFLEGLNWAALYALPVLFVCEDNGFAAYSRGSATTAGPGAAARAEVCGVRSISIDGTDAVALDDAVGTMVAAIRNGGGPRFLHACAYRWEGHTAADAAAWRPAGEVAAAKANDPIAKLADHLRRSGIMEAELAAIRENATTEMEAVRAVARDAPWPAAVDALADVQDIGAPPWPH